MSRFKLSRRTFLQGSGVTLALGPLDAMFNGNGTALAAGEPLPKRLLMFFWGNGAPLPFWVPSSTGANPTLPSSLQPLAGVRAYVRIISGLQADASGHAEGLYTTLKGGARNGPTLDQ